MALTLNELYKQSRDPLQQGIIANLLRKSDLIGLIPFQNTNALRVTATRWQADQLPSVAHRRIGASYTESTGKTEQVSETLFILGGEIKIDRVLLMDKSVIEDPVTTQTKQKTTAMAYEFNNVAINGDHATDPDTPEGMLKRVSNLPSRMTVDLASSGDALKVLANTANEQSFIDGLHKAVKYVGHRSQAGSSGAPSDLDVTVLIMNEATWLGVGQVLRRVGLLADATDQWDRSFDHFKGARLLDVGLKADQSTEIITSTENPGDGGSDGSSIYVARFNADDAFRGLQLNNLAPYEVTGEMETAPQMLRRIDWVYGFQQVGQYSLARIKGFKMAAS